MSHLAASIFWSAIGLIIGFPAGVVFERYRIGNKVEKAAMQGQKKLTDAHGNTPQEVGILIEGTEVDRVLVRPSPVPRAIAIILIIFGGFSVASTLFVNAARNDDRDKAQIATCLGQAQNRQLIKDIARGDQQIGDLLSGLTVQSNRLDNVAALAKAGDFFKDKAKRALAEPPPALSAEIIQDCEDGKLGPEK